MTSWEIKYTTSAAAPPLASGLLIDFYKRLDYLDAAMALASFKTVLKSGSTFEYEFKTMDGREWKQEIIMDQPSDPLMTFDVDDAFRVSEFEPHRELRVQVITMIRVLSLTKIEVKRV